ncbi:lipopolysaccharide biosynthesis protein [Lelliottia amnigena]|jgi:LPS O-antigen subunit length determinant protein (WzzB/FepE family)|uniref:LPS O-antigen length regulator Wzz(fepE) n=1 Tax=Lelliottia TaxID=1330545 RepID=UPI000743679A|nr:MULTISPECIES: LPS O-antigen length regulator Wzz(fepE) [Lelliottia]ATG02300.1 LPS O-antigen length regulator [Lelliottia amnigena]PEG65885.1 LPS O-antigen length regulator [Lelliottia amnigena]QXA22609.1 LPS O-antigen length regulator [Lelliottia amnigena]CAI9414436.1 Ferric enterobactin transport protein FepE [Lelliottia sp. T2.26D-8]VDZ90442.1 lipopolysaccharide biosynthesis protein [Lelliottia amnigena]
MSAMDFKKNRELDFARYSPPERKQNEIDFIDLIEVLLAAKKRIIMTVMAFAIVGAVVSFMMPQKWISKAIVTPPEQTQWNDVEQMLVTLKVLDVDFNIKREDAFELFIKKFQSQSLFQAYIKSSPYVMDQLKGANIDPLELHRAIVAISERMTAQDNAAVKNAATMPYTAWTLSFSAPKAQDAQIVLEGYIAYISAIVEKETMQNVRNAIALKTRMMKERLELDRVRLTNLHNITIHRLNYSLEVANAAGIKKPVFSNGQAVKDDPDYSVALGADGIAQKLAIEKSLKDVAELNADFQNREHHLSQLETLSVTNVSFEPFKYQLLPSLPMKKEGPGKALIIILAALVGGIVACGGVLIREAMHSRAVLSDPATA